MCGICGIVGRAAPSAPETIDRMTSVIRHRGPDDAGRHLEPGVALGHRRLSIVDLSPAGHQPMTNEDASVWLTYNGEIYNHAELRVELERRGHRYRSHTDSETILHAYEEWGDACVERFRGMFAFGLWDTTRRRLLLARDRLGVKPLYYAVVGRTLVFASEIKSILASRLLASEANEARLPEYLMFGYLAGEDTLFRGVRKLQPGHTLVWENERVTVRRYWDVSFTGDARGSEEELAEQFRGLFEESVRMRLMSDVPLGVFLSGGLDSSAIAAVMGRHVSGRLKTFSVGFESRFYSETSFARQVAEHIGSEHHEVILTAADFRAMLPRLIWHEDEPLWAPPSVALYKVAELAANNVTVVLTGEGSDELFGGYDRYWMSAWNARAWTFYGGWPAGARKAIKSALADGPLPERVRRALSHTIVNHDDSPDGLIFENWLGIFNPVAQRRLAGPVLREAIDAADIYADHRGFWDRADGAGVVDRMLYTDVKTNLVELLMKQDQMSMAASIESRVPFLDHRLVEFAATVPVPHKLRGLSGKRLVKTALARYLPAEILNRRKKGFPVPFDSWLNHEFAPDIRETLLDARTAARGWIDPAGVRAVFDEHARGRRNRSREIWALWMLELWARVCLDGESGHIAGVRRRTASPMTAAVAFP